MIFCSYKSSSFDFTLINLSLKTDISYFCFVIVDSVFPYNLAFPWICSIVSYFFLNNSLYFIILVSNYSFFFSCYWAFDSDITSFFLTSARFLLPELIVAWYFRFFYFSMLKMLWVSLWISAIFISSSFKKLIYPHCLSIFFFKNTMLSYSLISFTVGFYIPSLMISFRISIHLLFFRLLSEFLLFSFSFNLSYKFYFLDSSITDNKYLYINIKSKSFFNLFYHMNSFRNSFHDLWCC